MDAVTVDEDDDDASLADGCCGCASKGDAGAILDV